MVEPGEERLPYHVHRADEDGVVLRRNEGEVHALRRPPEHHGVTPRVVEVPLAPVVRLLCGEPLHQAGGEEVEVHKDGLEEEIVEDDLDGNLLNAQGSFTWYPLEVPSQDGAHPRGGGGGLHGHVVEAEDVGHDMDLPVPEAKDWSSEKQAEDTHVDGPMNIVLGLASGLNTGGFLQLLCTEVTTTIHASCSHGVDHERRASLES
mmetsp:Transcript_26420/g.58100  ORF Transcript_26420/g.58100 Transcript_26420/m.58100 type:complete len:205 (-) Transcript_26420:106-720(-)